MAGLLPVGERAVKRRLDGGARRVFEHGGDVASGRTTRTSSSRATSPSPRDESRNGLAGMSAGRLPGVIASSPRTDVVRPWGTVVTEYSPISTPGCIVRVKYVSLAYACRAEPTHAGLLRLGDRVFLAFACAEHAGRLIAPRVMLDRDRTELGRRRHSTEWARVGHDPLPIDPLAIGAAASRLIERAQAWAVRHADGPGLAGRDQPS
jgi:hypothetical protein